MGGGEVSDNRELTFDESHAIQGLKLLAKGWPKSLMLFSWSGTLTVMRSDADLSDSLSANEAVLATISGIPNNGGDP
jgi:hypothetical protein